mgnify:CR=1 FL=1
MHAINIRLIQVALLVVILGGWQLGVVTGVIDRFLEIAGDAGQAALDAVNKL